MVTHGMRVMHMQCIVFQLVHWLATVTHKYVLICEYFLTRDSCCKVPRLAVICVMNKIVDVVLDSCLINSISPLSMAIFLIEYPRSKRRPKPDGSPHKNVERP